MAQAPQALLAAQRLAQRLDNQWRIPVVNIRVGWDALLGLLPVGGDVLSLLLSLSMLRHARRLGAPKALQAQLVKNVLLDFVVGLLPVVGDVADVFLRANQRNVRLLERWWLSHNYQAIKQHGQQQLAQWQQQQQ